METYNFHRVSDESPDTKSKLCVTQNFHTRKLGKIYVFYTVSQCYEKSAFRIMEGIEINENIGTKWVYV